MKNFKEDTARTVDPRTWILNILVGAVGIIFIHSNIGGMCLFVWCMILQLISRRNQYIIMIFNIYIILTALTWVGVQLLLNDSLYFLGLALSNMGILGRKAIIPISYSICLAKEPTGALLASIHAIKLPKAVGIGIAVLLRFFPTMGNEYHAIRRSQRFRGIGVGVFHTITHLPSTVEYILIPLVLRTTRVAEELSASMTVRGVRFSGRTISYRPIGFTKKDTILCMISILIPIVILHLERMGIF